MPFGRTLARRLALTLVTLWLLSVIVFAGGQLLPGTWRGDARPPGPIPARSPISTTSSGSIGPLLVQYGEWIGRFVTGDMGRSYAFRTRSRR